MDTDICSTSPNKLSKPTQTEVNAVLNHPKIPHRPSIESDDGEDEDDEHTGVLLGLANLQLS